MSKPLHANSHAAQGDGLQLNAPAPACPQGAGDRMTFGRLGEISHHLSANQPRAMRPSAAQGKIRAQTDILRGLAPMVGIKGLQRLTEGMAAIRGATQGMRPIEVRVGFHKSRQHQPAF